MLDKIKAGVIKAQAYAKLIAALVGGALTIGASFIPADWRGWIITALAILTAFSVYKFPNITPEVAE